MQSTAAEEPFVAAEVHAREEALKRLVSTFDSAIVAFSAAKPFLVAGRRTGSRGVASVPVGSLTATPQRAEP